MPLYMLLGGGLLGAVYVTVTLVLAPRIGVAAVMALGIAGQLVTALLIDRLGLFELMERDLSVGRVERRRPGAGRGADGAAAVAPLPLRTDLFDYQLPEELIALRPVHRATPRGCWWSSPDAAEPLADHVMTDLPELLAPGDALVFNDTKVIPAALKGVRDAR